MKNIVLSAVAVLAMSSFAVAGGDIAPVEEPVVVVEPVITDSGMYLGLAYSYLNASIDDTLDSGATKNYMDEDFSDIMLQAGYKFNSYVAIEGRYWFGLDTAYHFSDFDATDRDVNVDAWGIYVKPMYPVTDAFDIYALLGYASADFNMDGVDVGNGYRQDLHSQDLDGFSWGIGAAYSFSDSLAVFVDYVSIYDDSTDHIAYTRTRDLAGTFDSEISTWNFGVTYQF